MNTPPDRMELELYVPAAGLVKTAIRKLSAEGAQGAFTLLPRHIDMVTTLAPGLLVYLDDAGANGCWASTRGRWSNAAPRCGSRCSTPSRRRSGTCATRWRAGPRLDDSERAARTALARLEAGAIRGMMEFER